MVRPCVLAAIRARERGQGVVRYVGLGPIGATSYFETGLAALLSMRLQRLCPHAEERRSRVSKGEIALPSGTESI